MCFCQSLATIGFCFLVKLRSRKTANTPAPGDEEKESLALGASEKWRIPVFMLGNGVNLIHLEFLWLNGLFIIDSDVCSLHNILQCINTNIRRCMMLSSYFDPNEPVPL